VSQAAAFYRASGLVLWPFAPFAGSARPVAIESEADSPDFIGRVSAVHGRFAYFIFSPREEQGTCSISRKFYPLRPRHLPGRNGGRCLHAVEPAPTGRSCP